MGKPKTLDNSSPETLVENVPDVQIVGNPDNWVLLCKASSEAEGWMKSTKAMEVSPMGCVVQVATQQRNADDSYSVSEALVFVPGARIKKDTNGGWKLAR